MFVSLVVGCCVGCGWSKVARGIRLVGFTFGCFFNFCGVCCASVCVCVFGLLAYPRVVFVSF